jgi:SAM-dependent methyltransferase
MIRTGVIGGSLGYRILRRVGGQGEASGRCDGSAYRERSKLEVLFGPDFWRQIAGRTVLDFGCGAGDEAIEIARHGAQRVIGLDIRETALAHARQAAAAAGVGDRCRFVTRSDEPADVIVSIDGFEHYERPDEVLQVMSELLAPGGRVLVAFGPPWFHPMGGHLFSVFPWSHLLFTERALIRWRSDFKTDGARRFGEVEGGLNQMTVHRFRRIVAASPLRAERFETVPIRRLRALANPLTREWLTSIVRCALVRRADSRSVTSHGAA